MLMWRRRIAMTDPLLKPSQDVLVRRLPGGAVLVQLSSNRIFELNDTAARLWEILSEGCTRSTLLERLAAEFTVDRQRATAEIDALLSEMSREGLLSGI